MRKLDLFVYVILFILGTGVCWVGLQMGYGAVSQPGSGFLPFWCGALMTMIPLGLLFHWFWKRQKVSPQKENSFAGIDPLKPLIILGDMVLYGLFFEKLGFLLCNFIFLILLLKFVWGKGWGFVLKASLLIDMGFYLTLEVLMKVPFPQGILARILSFL